MLAPPTVDFGASVRHSPTWIGNLILLLYVMTIHTYIHTYIQYQDRLKAIKTQLLYSINTIHYTTDYTVQYLGENTNDRVVQCSYKTAARAAPRFLVLDVCARSTVGEVLHDRPCIILPAKVQVLPDALPLIRLRQPVVKPVLRREACAEPSQPRVHKSSLSGVHGVFVRWEGVVMYKKGGCGVKVGLQLSRLCANHVVFRFLFSCYHLLGYYRSG